MDTCICMAEFLHCSSKTITTLLTGYTLIQNKKLRRICFPVQGTWVRSLLGKQTTPPCGGATKSACTTTQQDPECLNKTLCSHIK